MWNQRAARKAAEYMGKEIAAKLVGRRIVKALIDDAGNFGFALDDGQQVWVSQDAEGNGPGWLEIVEIQVGTVALKESQFGNVDNVLMADASELGWKVGVIPVTVKVGSRVFARTRTVEQDGDVIGWEFESEDGRDMLVAND